MKALRIETNQCKFTDQKPVLSSIYLSDCSFYFLTKRFPNEGPQFPQGVVEIRIWSCETPFGGHTRAFVWIMQSILGFFLFTSKCEEERFANMIISQSSFGYR